MKKMKKIAHVLVLPKMAGSQKFCHSLLSKITGYEKYVLVSGCEKVDKEQKKQFIEAFESINVNIIWCKHLTRNIGKSDLKGFVELYQIFKKQKYDIVHTNSTKPGILARIAARLAGISKIIHTVHGTSFFKGQPQLKRFIFWAIEAFALQFGHINVCVNKYYIKYYKCFFWKRSITIYNGYDFSELHRHLPENKRMDNRFSFLFVGRLDRPKNPMTLIKAFSIISSKYPGIHLDIVGDGELIDECKEMISDLGLGNKVSLHGWIEKPYDYFCNAHVFVCPSIYEAFGFTFVEAAYFKKPILASNVEGIPEVVVDGKMGFLIEPTDYNSLASKMELLIKSPELCESMGNYGHNYVVENFNISQCINKYQHIYDSSWKGIKNNA